MLDISDIRMISIIAREGSINRASELLNLSQPTVSKRLSRLEHKLGLDLFYRDSVGMVPTPAATFLQQAGLGLEDQLSAMERQVELMSQKASGHVSIGVGPIVEQRFLSRVLLDFAEGDYEFGIRVHVDSPNNLLERLHNGRLDIVLGPFSEEECRGEFKVVLSHSEPLVCLVRPGHPLALRGSKIEPSDIAESDMIVVTVPDSLEHELVKAVGPVKQLEPKILYDNLVMAKNIVLNSDYVTSGPESVFHREIESGELVAIPFAESPTWTCKCIGKPQILAAPIVEEVVSLFAQYIEG